MKTFYAIYSKDDIFIDCGFNLTRLIAKRKPFGSKIFRIPTNPQNDIFKTEDEEFIKENKDQVYTNKERADQLGVSTRTIYRRKAKAKLKRKVEL